MSRNTSSMEVVFSQSEQLVSITDVRGVITYVNDDFARVAGYSRDELVGQNHNIMRHPDMPAGDLWDKLKNISIPTLYRWLPASERSYG